MIITYSKKDKKINSLEETDFSEQGIMERKDIEAWIEKYPDILGEDFYIISTEYDGFDKTNERLDLMAIDSDGKLTIIELKRGSSGKYADLQALRYAAYCSTITFNKLVEINRDYLLNKGINDSYDVVKEKILNFITTNPDFEELDGKPRIVLVASDYTPEVTSTVIWLNKFELDISCVKFQPYKLDNDNIVFESSVIIPLPEEKDFQIENERRTSQENLNRTQEEYLKFYTKIMEGIKNKINLQLRRPPIRSYYQIPTDIPGIHYEWVFSGRPKCFSVNIHFENKRREFNEKYFNEIIKLKDKLEKETNEKIIVDTNWQKSGMKIYIQKELGNNTDELIKWGIENMIIFINIINDKLNMVANGV